MTMADLEPSVVKEYRVVLPMTVDEFRRAHLYSIAEASKKETGGGEGVEIVTNEPFEGVIPGERSGDVFTGQYTYKVYYLKDKVPAFIRLLAPAGSLEVHEKSWNSHPYCRTEYSNAYMKDSFYIILESRHYDDNGEQDNVHNLDAATLAKRDVVKINISDDVSPSDYKEDEDPTLYKSGKTGRGPVSGDDWQKTVQPVMCTYKLARINFKWWGLQTKVESIIVRAYVRMFKNFFRQLFCWTDFWHDLTMDDIRALEEKTKCELDDLRRSGEVRGMREK